MDIDNYFIEVCIYYKQRYHVVCVSASYATTNTKKKYNVKPETSVSILACCHLSQL